MRHFLCQLFVVAILCSAWTARSAAELTTGNLIVTVNEFTGSSTAPSYVAEYTTSGNRVQRFTDVPDPLTGSQTDHARDLVVFDGAIFLHNRASGPSKVLRLDPGLVSNPWTEAFEFEGWSTDSVTNTGGLEAFGNYIFATDSDTPNDGQPKGIVRFDTRDGSAIRFGTADPSGTEPYDLNLDPLGNVYAINNRSLNQIDVFDSSDGSFLRSVSISFDDWRSIDVAADGTIFVGNDDGLIQRYSSDGTLLDSLTLDSNAIVSDLDINDATGQIAIASSNLNDSVYLTDLNLDSFTSFRVTESNIGSRSLFVSWVNATAIPEPSSATFCAIPLVFALFSRRRSRGRRKGVV